MIPRLIHQTWRDRDVPQRFAAYVASWARFHPGWTARLWTDADLDALAAEHFPELLPMFRAYPYPIMRADLGRYMILAVHGGVYADLDAEALSSFEALAAETRPIFGEEPSSHALGLAPRSRGFSTVVGNAVIASPAGHPFWRRLLAMAERCRSAAGPLDATGPFMLTATIAAAPPADRPLVLPAYVFASRDHEGDPVPRPDPPAITPLADHHWAGTWYERGRPVSRSKIVKGWWRRRRVYRRHGDDGPDRSLLDAVDRTLIARQRPQGSNILIAIAARQVADCIDKVFSAILALETRARLSIAFLVGDSTDDTAGAIKRFRDRHGARFHRFTLIERDYGGRFEEVRWFPPYQRVRRGRIARARNDLIRGALADEDWILCIDADVSDFAPSILDRLLAVDARIVHPNCVFVHGERSFDLNAWVTEFEPRPDFYYRHVIDGLYQPPLDRFRVYLSDMRYHEEVALESVGGTMLLFDANLFRAGVIFPEAPYRRLIETEGFAALARDVGLRIVGLPNVETVHPVR
jgi:hypothetical protein